MRDTIAARIALTCGAGLIVFQIAILTLVSFNGWPVSFVWLRMTAHIADVTRIVDSVAASERPPLVALLDSPRVRVAARPADPADLQDEGGPRSRALHRAICAELARPSCAVIVGKMHAPVPSTDAHEAQGVGTRRERPFVIEVVLSDGQWLEFTVLDDFAPHAALSAFAVVTGVFCLVIGVLSAWMARRLAAPIADFARAAQRFGVDGNAPMLAERGPLELRAAARAFNQMQERLRRFIEDRTQMVAAMSHDLRTPLARLRLRAEFVQEPEQQRKMLSDIESMSMMVESTLVFARDDAQREPKTLVDLGMLIADLCDDMVDSGCAVSFSGTWGTSVTCRPTAVRRAVANLLDNAIKYGGVAQVGLVCEPLRVLIVIEDQGPGIPVEAHERVFAPFFRLEHSRNSDTGGVGLGLAVARTIVREHGGEVTLCNREAGGLSVQVELPR